MRYDRHWYGNCCKCRFLGICVVSLTATVAAFHQYWIDFGFSFILMSINWRIPILIQCLFAVVLLLGVHYMPECASSLLSNMNSSFANRGQCRIAPRWLISNGRVAEGQAVIAALENSPFDSPETVLRTRVILESMETKEIRRKRDVLTSGPSQHLRRTIIGASSQIMQQIGGANAIIYYAPLIYGNQLGLPRTLALVLGGVNA